MTVESRKCMNSTKIVKHFSIKNVINCSHDDDFKPSEDFVIAMAMNH